MNREGRREVRQGKIEKLSRERIKKLIGMR